MAGIVVFNNNLALAQHADRKFFNQLTLFYQDDSNLNLCCLVFPRYLIVRGSELF